jgi:hypothetical protein
MAVVLFVVAPAALGLAVVGLLAVAAAVPELAVVALLAVAPAVLELAAVALLAVTLAVLELAVVALLAVAPAVPELVAVVPVGLREVVVAPVVQQWVWVSSAVRLRVTVALWNLSVLSQQQQPSSFWVQQTLQL